MDYLQYLGLMGYQVVELPDDVLNLIINGLPSIRNSGFGYSGGGFGGGFKPYYKWITFNTLIRTSELSVFTVLNLIINGLPSILKPMQF